MIWFDETRRAQLLPRIESDLVQVRREAPDLVELGVAEAIHTYYIERDYPGALAAIEKVLARDPTNREALESHGVLLRRVGRYSEALPILQRIAALDPNNPGAINNLKDTLNFMRRYREAIAVLEAGLQRMPNQWQLAADWADERYALSGDVAQWEKDIEALRDRLPEDEWQFRRWERAEPSPERLAYYAALGDGWIKSPGGALFPTAIELAWEADMFGDTAQRDRYAAQAEAMYATLEPAVRARAMILSRSAQLLALQGKREAAIAESQAALESSLRSKDQAFHAWVQLGVAIALARAGEAEQSLDQLEALVANSVIKPVDIRDNQPLRKSLADHPRYQALLLTIEAGFERP
jgi:tetratricopeptide (TPR) repeat protein